MRLLDLLQSPGKLADVRPEVAAELLGEVTAWGAKIKMMMEHNNGNTGPSLRLLTTEEVATMLNVKKYFIAERTRRGEIRCVRLTKYVRYRLKDVLDYVERNR